MCGLSLPAFLLAALAATAARGEARDKAEMLAPFRAGGNDALHNLIAIPGMESAVTQKKGTVRVDVGTEINANSFDEISGLSGFNEDSTTFETRARLLWAPLNYLDLSGEMSATSYSGDVGAIFENQQAFGRVEGDLELSDPVLSARFQFWGGRREVTGLALRSGAKFVLGDESDLHSSGAVDYFVSLLGSLDLDWGVWHLNINYTFVGEEDLFLPPVDANLENPVSLGISYMFEVIENRLAAGGQLFAYPNAFRNLPGSLEGLDGPPISLLAGLRWFPRERFAFELAVGPGLSKDASDVSVFINLIYQR
ncbi:MAG: hypothetical protein HYU36_22020 [Planctomycetes bacterium]|nr:hypothetical protein [Planctomycetota bacterium]